MSPDLTSLFYFIIGMISFTSTIYIYANYEQNYGYTYLAIGSYLITATIFLEAIFVSLGYQYTVNNGVPLVDFVVICSVFFRSLLPILWFLFVYNYIENSIPKKYVYLITLFTILISIFRRFDSLYSIPDSSLLLYISLLNSILILGFGLYLISKNIRTVQNQGLNVKPALFMISIPFVVVILFSFNYILRDIVTLHRPIWYGSMSITIALAVWLNLFNIKNDMKNKILNTIDETIIVTDQNNIIQYINNANKTMFSEATIGEDIQNYIKENKLKDLQEESYIIVDDSNIKNTYRIEMNRRNIGKFSYNYYYITDVTEMVEFQNQIEQKNEQLEMISDTVIHDLSNHIMIARGWSEQMKRTDTDYTSKIIKSMDRMSETLKVTDKLFRTRSKKIVIENTYIRRISADVWESLNYPSNNLHIDSNFILKSDKQLLKTLLENLFKNSIQHNGRDTNIYIEKMDDNTGFTIRDTGKGFDETVEIEHIFDHGYTGDDGGSGLGLSIVEYCVTAHQWEISIDETYTEGAKFDITGVEIEQTIEQDIVI